MLLVRFCDFLDVRMAVFFWFHSCVQFNRIRSQWHSEFKRDFGFQQCFLGLDSHMKGITFECTQNLQPF